MNRARIYDVVCIHLQCFAFDESIKAEQLWILFSTIFKIVTVTL